ncbi:hypothetical protein RC77_02290 [Pectobacterium brasiliense]|uniref:BRO-N domain-containing protein n=1 Tax=Pectobacterium brasiliense TaxID=180957 RepID=UPI00057D482D|nr:BRO family protein [Pectobacterium brasiliense]KHS71948.1 hypothetical protein RC77_02290 [Pectobacterium brasiliense]
MNTTNTIKVTKMNFAGIQLDVITGHPEYELLFVGSQVVTALGHKCVKTTLSNFFRNLKALQWCMVQEYATNLHLKEPSGRALRRSARMMSEAQVYTLIMRSYTPQGEPFRKWVTEEVLPSIRKSGSYNVETSTTAEGIQFASEFAAVNAELKALRGQIEELKAIIQAQPKVTVTERRLGLYSRVCLKIHDKAQGSAPEETTYISIGLSNPSLLGETA